MFRKLNVLILCERTQTSVGAFTLLGHNALSVDLQPCLRSASFKELHYTGDALDFLASTPSGYWDLIIAHPPCTYLTKAGAFHLHHDPQRWTKMYDAVDFFNELFRLSCLKSKHVAFENPSPHKYARSLLPPISDYIEPYFFGSRFSKRTYLWLYNLPPLMSTGLYSGKPYSFVLTSGNSNTRSKSFPEISAAMASQWTDFILQYE